MIQLPIRPATPAQLQTPEVQAAMASIAQRAAEKTVCSADFTPLWGNAYAVYQLTASSLDAWRSGVDDDAVMVALQPLLGHAHQGVQAFKRALKSVLAAVSGAYTAHKEHLCNAAKTPTVPYCLWVFQHRKCCYCEHTMKWELESDVEHFRPKGNLHGVSDHLGYWWLAYAWDNLFLACKVCNSQYKGNQFPLAPDGKRAVQPGDALVQEKAVLLHPITDNPEHCIQYVIAPRLVKAVAKDARGKQTINQLTGINDVSRMQARSELVTSLQFVGMQMADALKKGDPTSIDHCANAIRAETACHRPFAGFRRFYFRDQGFAEYVS